MTREETDRIWTTRQLLEWMTGHFKTREIDSPRVVAEMLLSHVIGCDRMRLYMEVDRPAQPDELASLRSLVARAARHEPGQYLVGHAWFFARQFEVTRSVLIPRPSTETLVEHVIQWCRSRPEHGDPLIADIGTGSGCVAVSLAIDLKTARIVATDVDDAAIAVARRNAAAHGVEGRIEFRTGAGMDPLGGAPGAAYDVICANPPYISDSEWLDVAPNVKDHEPPGALRGGADGLSVIRSIIAGAGPLLKPGGRLVLEIADSQRDEVHDLVMANEVLANPVVHRDHEGFWRVLVAELGPRL